MQPLTQAGWPLSLLCQVHVHSVLYNTCSVSGSLGLFAGAYCFLFHRRLCTMYNVISAFAIISASWNVPIPVCNNESL
jgi:hypothetical protein